MEEGKPKASTLLRFFIAFQFWQVNPPTRSAHCFCMFFALFSHIFRFLAAFHSRHPHFLASQMLPGQVPRVCLSHPCHAPPSPAASLRHPVRNPAPTPTAHAPTCPRPAHPAAARPGQAPQRNLPSCLPAHLKPATDTNPRFLSVSIDLYQRTDRKEKKNQETKREARKREREREREHEGVRASFFAAVDQSSYFLHFGVHFLDCINLARFLCIFWLLLFLTLIAFFGGLS